MATAPEKCHIESTPGTCGGKPRIAGTRIRVQDIVFWTEEGRSPDEIVRSFPHWMPSPVEESGLNPTNVSILRPTDTLRVKVDVLLSANLGQAVLVFL